MASNSSKTIPSPYELLKFTSSWSDLEKTLSMCGQSERAQGLTAFEPGTGTVWVYAVPEKQQQGRQELEILTFRKFPDAESESKRSYLYYNALLGDGAKGNPIRSMLSPFCDEREEDSVEAESRFKEFLTTHDVHHHCSLPLTLLNSQDALKRIFSESKAAADAGAVDSPDLASTSTSTRSPEDDSDEDGFVSVDDLTDGVIAFD